MIGDMNKERLAHAEKVGFEPIDLNAHDRLGELVAAVDMGDAGIKLIVERSPPWAAAPSKLASPSLFLDGFAWSPGAPTIGTAPRLSHCNHIIPALLLLR